MAVTVFDPPPLPGPAERPDAAVLIFDGQCRFCRAQMQRLNAIDTQARLAFLCLHDPETTRRWPELTHEELMDHMYLIDQQGHKYAGAAAFRYLTSKLPWLWCFAPIMHIPGTLPFWQLCYRQIAKMRYRFGRVGECEGGSCRRHID